MTPRHAPDVGTPRHAPERRAMRHAICPIGSYGKFPPSVPHLSPYKKLYFLVLLYKILTIQTLKKGVLMLSHINKWAVLGLLICFLSGIVSIVSILIMVNWIVRHL